MDTHSTLESIENQKGFSQYRIKDENYVCIELDKMLNFDSLENWSLKKVSNNGRYSTVTLVRD